MVSPICLSVLILEDQEADFVLVMRELRRAGFTVHCLRAESEAEFRLQLQGMPDIILTDYDLGPKFNAFRALEVLQESGFDIPVIVLTGVVSEEPVVDCMRKGAADYLFKDRLMRLGPAVMRALKDSESRREKRRAEEALQNTRQHFQNLVETTKVIPWELNLETWQFTYVGPQAVTLLDIPWKYGAAKDSGTSTSI